MRMHCGHPALQPCAGAAITTLFHSVAWYNLAPVFNPNTGQQQADTAVQSNQILQLETEYCSALSLPADLQASDVLSVLLSL